jgi:hypothetical protein
MSDEKRYTERELIEAKREGYVAAMHEEHYASGYSEGQAARRYPLPKVKRRRVVQLGGFEYRASGSPGEDVYGLLIRDAALKDDPWVTAGAFNANNLRGVRALADLIANPDEEVEA